MDMCLLLKRWCELLLVVYLCTVDSIQAFRLDGMDKRPTQYRLQDSNLFLKLLGRDVPHHTPIWDDIARVDYRKDDDSYADTIDGFDQEKRDFREWRPRYSIFKRFICNSCGCANRC